MARLQVQVVAGNAEVTLELGDGARVVVPVTRGQLVRVAEKFSKAADKIDASEDYRWKSISLDREPVTA